MEDDFVVGGMLKIPHHARQPRWIELEPPTRTTLASRFYSILYREGIGALYIYLARPDSRAEPRLDNQPRFSLIYLSKWGTAGPYPIPIYRWDGMGASWALYL